MQIISKHEPAVIAQYQHFPTIQHNNSVSFIQTFLTTSSRSISVSVRHNTRSFSLATSEKLPYLEFSKVASNYTPNERVIYEAYNMIMRNKTQVTEKGDLYTDLASYLVKKCQHKPLFMGRTDWTREEITIDEAIETFKPYYEYLEDLNTKSFRRRESVKYNEIELYARLFEKGDTDRMGWDKSDVFDIIGKYSPNNAYYLIEKYGISRNNRLQFGEFLRNCLPEHKNFDESYVNRYYSTVHKRKTLA